MSNQIRLKRGSGSDPGTSDLVVGEVALRTDTGQLFTKKDDGNIEEIGAQAGISDGDKGDITVSNSGSTFTIDNGVVTSAKIADGTIVNADINASAAIAGSKIDPSFTGTVTSSYLTLSAVNPNISFTDTNNNPDFKLEANSGQFKIIDSTNSADRLIVQSDGQVDIGGMQFYTSNNVAIPVDGARFKLGANDDFGIRHDAGGPTIFDDANNQGVKFQFKELNITEYTGSTTKLKLDTNGNVGIGTSTIADDVDHCKLVISGQSGTAAGVLIFQDTSNNEDGMVFADNGNLYIVADRANATSNSKIIFRVDGSSQKMQLDSSGNLTIEGTVDGVDIAAAKTTLDSICTSNGNILNGTFATTQAAGNNTARIATTAFVTTAIANLVDSAPGTLNTLNELAAALGDDPNFATTVTNSIATKLPLAGGTLTGDLTISSTLPVINLTDTDNNSDYQIKNGNGDFNIKDVTNGVNRLTIASGGTVSTSANLDVGNTLYVAGVQNLGNGSGNSILSIKKADDNVADHIRFFNGTTRTGEIGSSDDTWLRINNQTNKNIFTPRFIRADGGFFVDGETKGINGSGNFVNGTIAGASDYGTLLRSDTADTASGVITFTSSSQYPININNSHDGKIVLQGANNPYITFREGSSDKAYLQWHSNGYVALQNNETGEDLRLQSGNNGLKFGVDGTFYNVWHQGNDGSGSTLDADTVDGLDSTQFVRSDASDTLTGDTYTFGGSEDEKIILSGSNNPFIRFKEGSSTKAYIQWNSGGYLLLVNQESSEQLRIASGSNGLIFHEGGVSHTVWHSGNDGAGSGLNADTLDGVTSLSFLRSDQSDTATGNITFTDNTQAKFGTGGDLEIFHDGSNSYISDQGTGSLILKSSTIDFTNAAQNEFLARFFQDSAVELYFNGEKKWETTADGVNLVDNKLTFQGTANRNIIFRAGNNDILYEFDAGDFYRQNIGNSTHEFFVGNTERLRVQNGSVYVNGSLGIGTTSPARALHMQSGSDFGIRLTKTAHSDAEIKNTSSLDLCCSSGGAGGQVVRILTGASPTSLNEQMRVAGTKVLIGMNSTQISSPNNPRMQVYQQMGIMAQDNANQRTALVFQNPAGRQGFINTNASGITIVGTSDYRVKENINYSIDGINKIKQVKPCTFNFKADEENTIVHGFIAHELQEVLPEAVTGEKDEVVTQAKIDAGEYEQETLGNEVHQGVDAGKLIPLLTKALQETISKVEVLETEVATLKAS